VGGGWAALGLAAVILLLGPTLRWAQWFQDISPFTHVPKLPGGTGSTVPLAWLVLIAAALATVGLVGLRRRDIS
jgi:ABC-2 type transport system permease protein